MILRGIAKRYAVALFNAAVQQDIAEQVQEDLASVDNLMKENPEFRNYLLSPQVLTEDKKQLLVDTLAERSAGLLIKFLLLLIDKKRLEHTGEIAEAYTYLFEQLQGILEAKVVTAVPLDGELEQKTIEKLEKETGKTIRLTKTVDPDIIGGMIVVLEDTVIDGSIRHQLDSMKKSLGEVRVH
jgi:F-type H+-transporting ATPase subunit delta